MEKFIPTTHLIEDRMDRIVFIATKVGFGEIVEEFYIEDNHGKHYECVTSTGVIIVKDLSKKVVVTMFVGRIGQIKRLYGDRKIPQNLLTIVKRNEKKKFYEISG